MAGSTPNRHARTLAVVAAIAFYGLVVAATLLLVMMPVGKVLGGPNGDFHYGLPVPVKLLNPQTTIETAWGSVPLKLDDSRAELRLPVSRLPWSLVAVLWVYTALAAAVLLLFVHNLRRIFQRVRDGAAFDAQNAFRLRRLGTLLLAFALLESIGETATAWIAKSGLVAGSGVTVQSGLSADGRLVLAAFVLIALAEVFRKGADLEREQSLVI